MRVVKAIVSDYGVPRRLLYAHREKFIAVFSSSRTSELKATDRQFAPHEKQRRKPHLAPEQIDQDRRRDLLQIDARGRRASLPAGRGRAAGGENADFRHRIPCSQQSSCPPIVADRTTMLRLTLRRTTH